MGLVWSGGSGTFWSRMLTSCPGRTSNSSAISTPSFTSQWMAMILAADSPSALTEGFTETAKRRSSRGTATMSLGSLHADRRYCFQVFVSFMRSRTSALTHSGGHAKVGVPDPDLDTVPIPFAGLDIEVEEAEEHVGGDFHASARTHPHPAPIPPPIPMPIPMPIGVAVRGPPLPSCPAPCRLPCPVACRPCPDHSPRPPVRPPTPGIPAMPPSPIMPPPIAPPGPKPIGSSGRSSPSGVFVWSGYSRLRWLLRSSNGISGAWTTSSPHWRSVRGGRGKVSAGSRK